MKQKIRPLSKESSYRGLKVTNSSKSLTTMAAKWILKSFFHKMTFLFYLTSFYSKRMGFTRKMIKNFSKEILFDFFI